MFDSEPKGVIILAQATVDLFYKTVIFHIYIVVVCEFQNKL